MDSTSRVRTVYRQLARRYWRAGVADVVGLTALIERLEATSLENVEITANAYEGGSATGVLVLNRLESLAAAQVLLAEWCSEDTYRPPDRTAIADFRFRDVQT